MMSTRTDKRTMLIGGALGMGIGLMLLGGGCQQALFPKDTPRHQFQTHQQMRGQYTPTQEPDVFGNPQPALRARLSQPQ